MKADKYVGFYEYLFYGQHPSVARIDEASFFYERHSSALEPNIEQV